jgi:hypothetical protein
MTPEPLIAKARAVRIEGELARRGVRLKRQGGPSFAGPCPSCGGTDRFSINVKKQLWNCRGCGTGGNVIQLVQHLDGLTFPDAVRLLAGESEKRQQARPPQPKDDTDGTKAALTIWQQARDPRDTLVERYLRDHRGLELPLAEAIRFHPDCPYGESFKPCMVALVRGIIGNAPQAIHRTALNPDGTAQRDADGKKLCRSQGPIRGGAIKLTSDEDVTLCLGVGEGIESALSLRQRCEFGLSPVWSMVCAGGFSWLPVLSGVESLWIAVDHDKPDKNGARAGQMRAFDLARRWANEGREVFKMMSSVEGEDLNDVVREQ